MAGPMFAPPSEAEREVFEALVAYGRPLWEALPRDSALRHVCVQGMCVMADYLYNGTPPPI